MNYIFNIEWYIRQWIAPVIFNFYSASLFNITGAANDFAHNEEHDISPIEDAAARGKI